MLSLSSPQRRLLAFYEWRRGTSAVTTVANINAVFGEKSVNYSTVHRWFTRFEEGDTDFEDKPRSGRPTTVEDSTILEVIKENPEASVRELATKIGCSHMTIDRRLSNLGYRKVLAQWIPHALTDGQRMTRLSICQSLLLRSNRKDFLEDVVTGDESWILYDAAARRAFWLPRGAQPPIQSKPDLHPKKVLLCCFWDSGKRESATCLLDGVRL